LLAESASFASSRQASGSSSGLSFVSDGATARGVGAAGVGAGAAAGGAAGAEGAGVCESGPANAVADQSTKASMGERILR
jgi:hypothetical protein